MPIDPEDRGADGKPRVGATLTLASMEPIRAAADERLHRRIARMRRLHDRRAGGTRPPHRLHPDRERTLAGGEPGSPGREIRVEDRDEVQAGDAEVAHGVRPADEHLAGGPRQSGLRNAPNRDARRSRRPGLDPFGAAAPHAERGPAAGGASARCFTDHTPDLSFRGAERATAHGARRRGATSPADLRDAGSGQRREEEAPVAPRRARGRAEARDPRDRGGRSPPFGQRFVVGATVGSPSDAASVDGQAAASTADRAAERGAAKRNVAHVVIGRTLLAVCGVRLARDPDQPRGIGTGANTAGRVPTTTS